MHAKLPNPKLMKFISTTAKKQKFDVDKLKTALSVSSSKQNGDVPTAAAADVKKLPKQATSIVDAAKAKLKASRFRYLNELLYTQEGKKSLQMFEDDPDAFHTYHEGYADQVNK